MFSKLKNTDPSFHGLATERYWQLRTTTFNPDSILARYEAYFAEMKRCGADKREIARWSGGSDLAGRVLDFDAELVYLRTWWRQHIAYLDTKVFIPYPEGDTNFDRAVDITDVITIVDYLLDGNVTAFNHYKADVDKNGTIDITDLTDLIDLILSMSDTAEEE